MLARRIAIAASALFLLIVVAASVADREAQDSRAVAPATVAEGPPAPVVRGELPRDGVVRAQVGEVVSVTVRTSSPDDASIPQLGLNAPTSADVPGVLEFVATQPGRYPVVLVGSEKPAGTVVVEGPGS